MKKLYLTLAGGVLVFSAWADLSRFDISSLETQDQPVVPFKSLDHKLVPQTPTRAGNDIEGLVFGYCDNIESTIGLTAESVPATTGQAIEIPAETAEQWIGSEVIGVVLGFGTSLNQNVELFITPDFEENPEYVQSAHLETLNGWNTVVLDEPYEITGNGFFVGYTTVVNTTQEKPLTFDGNRPGSPYSHWFGVDGLWEDMYGYLGNNCIKIILAGDNLPQYSAEFQEIALPGFVQQNEAFPLEFQITNTGVKSFNNVTVQVTIGDSQVFTTTATLEAVDPNQTLGSGDTGWFMCEEVACEVIGTGLPIVAKLLAINSNNVEGELITPLYSVVSCSETAYSRNVVIEEYTGTWCGWCPMGIVAMKYMKEKYPDTFIGIAVHFGQNDPMIAPTYSSAVSTFDPMGSAPYAVIDRFVNFLDPDANRMENYYTSQSEYGTYGKIEATAVYSEDSNKVEVGSTSTFALDIPEGNYGVAFVVIEDKVGPYYQINYYSGGGSGEMGGWEKAGGNVSTYYNEVARYITAPFGQNGSIPSSITKNQGYDYSTSIPVSTKWKLTDCEVVALLINIDTYEIVNATQVAIANTEAGVDGIEKDKEEILKVYNPQGVKVLETKDSSELNNLPKGIYIINGKKVLL